MYIRLVFTFVSEARVMWDMKTDRSRGYGFVAFRDRGDAEKALSFVDGEWNGSRVIRCIWANQKGQPSISQQQAKAKRTAHRQRQTDTSNTLPLGLCKPGNAEKDGERDVWRDNFRCRYNKRRPGLILSIVDRVFSLATECLVLSNSSLPTIRQRS